MTTNSKTPSTPCCAECDSEQHLIAEGVVQEFDAALGEISFDGDLVNKGTILIKSSDPAQAEAILRAGKVINEGEIISEVPTLTINAAMLGGTGSYRASETICVHNDDAIQIRGGRFYSEWFRPSTKGKLTINAQRIDAKIDLKAYELSIGVNEGNLDIIKQKLDGDPIYYNRGGNITAVMPGNGFDIYVLAAGDITLSGVDATGLDGEIRSFVAQAGLHFASNVDDGNSQFACGGFGGVSCAQTIIDNSGPGQIFEPAPGGPFPPSGTITINGAIAKNIDLTARDIVIDGTLDARQDNRAAGPSIILQAANSITVNAPLKTSANTTEPNFGSIALQAPTIAVNAKITSDIVIINAFENSVATTGSITTAAIEARNDIFINGGHIQFTEVGGGLLPLSQPHDSGLFTIKTGKLTAHRAISLAATGNIDAGNIELLPNELQVPLAEHMLRIHANVGKENASPLKIGGGTNGAASLTVHGTTDLGEGLTQKAGSIFLTNGPSGDIVLDGAKIFITSEHNGTPSLIAYAGTGKVTVTGNIKFDGTSAAPAGQILLVGDEIKSSGATISAKDTLSSEPERPAKVIFVASKLTLTGDLNVEADSKAHTSVQFVPKGSVTLDPQDHAVTLFVDKFPINVTEEQILVAGAGNLNVTTKSEGAKVLFTGTPLKFNNSGTSTVISEGTGSLIKVDFAGAPSGQNSLVFGGGAVTFNASNPNGDAGEINVIADKVANTATSVALKANSLSNGNGGDIVVSVDRGNLTLGSALNAISMSATSNSGNGGSITVENAQHNGTLTLDSTFSEAAMTVAVLGSNGDGGIISLHSDHLVNNTGNPNLAFVANGAGSGEGGTVDFTLTDAIQLTAANGLAFRAEGGSSGDGGNVSVKSTQGSVTIEGAKISVHGGTDSKGGNITVRAPQGSSTLKITGTLNANGDGNGKGGEVILKAGGTLDIGQGTLQANGGPRGAGGLVDITSGANLTVQSSQISAQAGATGSNAGGRIKISTTDDASLTVQGTLDVTGVGNAKGGDINISSTGLVDLTQANLIADGGQNGAGGSIKIEFSGAGELVVGDISASTSLQTQGGSIQITNNGDSDLQVTAKGDLKTTSNEELSGSLTLAVSDEEGANISLAIDEGGFLASILSATGREIAVGALSDVSLGLLSVESKDGDIDLCLDGSGSCAVALTESKKEILASNSKVKVVQSGQIIAKKKFRCTVPVLENAGTISADEESLIGTSNLKNDGSIICSHGTITISAIETSSTVKNLAISGNNGIIASQASVAEAIKIQGVNNDIPTHVSFTGTHILQVPTTDATIVLRSGISPLDEEDPSTLDLTGATLTVNGSALELFAPIININGTSSIQAPTSGVLVSTFQFKNAGLINAKAAIFANGNSQTLSQGGSVNADLILLGESFDGQNVLPGLNVAVQNQSLIASEQIVFSALNLNISEDATVDAQNSVRISTTLGTNNATITCPNGAILISDATPLGTTQLDGLNGVLDCSILQIDSSRATVVDQLKISGLIQGNTLGGSITSRSDNMKVGAIESFASLSLIAEDANLSLEAGSSGIVVHNGNLLAWTKNGSKALSLKSNLQVRASNGGSGSTVTMVIGAMPATFAAGVKPGSILLLNQAVLGTNVFFGSGVTASGANTIDINPNGLVRFNGPVDFQGGVVFLLT